MDVLLGACKIEINALRFVKMKAYVKEEYDFDLRVLNPPTKDGSMMRRTIDLFSSNPQIVYAPQNKIINRYIL